MYTFFRMQWWLLWSKLYWIVQIVLNRAKQLVKAATKWVAYAITDVNQDGEEFIAKKVTLCIFVHNFLQWTSDRFWFFFMFWVFRIKLNDLKKNDKLQDVNKRFFFPWVRQCICSQYKRQYNDSVFDVCCQSMQCGIFWGEL